MMEVRELLKARFTCARQDLEKALQRLTDQDLPWSPGVGMRTIGNQLVEIANKEKETLVWARTGVWPDEAPDAFDEETATIEEIRVVLAELRAATYAYIDSLSDTELEGSIANPNRWLEALRLPECPLSEVLRSIATHEVYHTGQLYLYFWLRGDDPNEW